MGRRERERVKKGRVEKENIALPRGPRLRIRQESKLNPGRVSNVKPRNDLWLLKVSWECVKGVSHLES